MYLHILNETLIEILDRQGKKPEAITIVLTPMIYRAFQNEINSVCHFITEMPITKIGINTLSIHGRSVTIACGKELNPTFEKHLVGLLNDYTNSSKDSTPLKF